jgi:hypothetical protein
MSKAMAEWHDAPVRGWERGWLQAPRFDISIWRAQITDSHFMAKFMCIGDHPETFPHIMDYYMKSREKRFSEEVCETTPLCVKPSFV